MSERTTAETRDGTAGTAGTGHGSRLVTTRGHTDIAPRAVERIASRAAREIDGVGAVERSGLSGFLSRSDAPSADAEVDETSTAVKLELSIRYPEPLRAVTRRVREHVMSRVEELTGLAVPEVDIVVSRLDVAIDRPKPPRVV